MPSSGPACATQADAAQVRSQRRGRLVARRAVGGVDGAVRDRLPVVIGQAIDAHVAHVQVRPVVGVLNVEVATRYGDVAVELHFDLVQHAPRRLLASRDRADVLRFGLRPSVGVGVHEVIRQHTPERGRVPLADGGVDDDIQLAQHILRSAWLHVRQCKLQAMILERLDVTAQQFEDATGWAIKPAGACLGDVCVPLGGGPFNLAAVADRLGMPLVQDAERPLWALGPSSLGGRALSTAQAPELILPDLDGRPFALSSLRGQKVVLVAWAPY
jgi:hypothetical protein